MLQKYKDKREEGFTIIEVLIVLAIAGLIILIVFLAVPALQRNSRNTQRTNDASRMAAAVSECLNNNNGQITQCNDFSAAQLNTYVTVANNQQLTAATGSGLNSFAMQTGAICNDQGTGVNSGATTGNRSFVILYQVETNGGNTANRCLSS